MNKVEGEKQGTKKCEGERKGREIERKNEKVNK
jgi:hypothetical protein